MPDWKTRVEMADLSLAFEKGTMTSSEAGKEMASRLKQNKYHEELDEIIDMFENVEDVQDFDYALGELYDFGDEDHRIWVNCFQ